MSPDPERPRQENPYPNGSDPRPWWFKQFEERTTSELHDIKEAIRAGAEGTNRRLGALEEDRSVRRGVTLTGRTTAQGLGALAAAAAIIGLLLDRLIGGGGG